MINRLLRDTRSIVFISQQVKLASKFIIRIDEQTRFPVMGKRVCLMGRGPLFSPF
jgi:hypothetical protein